MPPALRPRPACCILARPDWTCYTGQTALVPLPYRRSVPAATGFPVERDPQLSPPRGEDSPMQRSLVRRFLAVAGTAVALAAGATAVEAQNAVFTGKVTAI